MICPFSNEFCECPGRCDVDVLVELEPDSDMARAAELLRVGEFFRATEEAAR